MLIMEYADYFEANRELWNQRTLVHRDSAFYNREAFLKGATVLTPIEATELKDVAGKKMLHLQCHFGMDSLDWARRGALVTGVDLSDEAIREARELNNILGLDARFICCNVYELKDHLAEAGSFDIVFTSYGTIGWLPDLDPWAELIAHYLKPGGQFYFAEFHPVLWMFDDDFTKVAYDYQSSEPIVETYEGTYADKDAAITQEYVMWNHALSEVFQSLIHQNLEIKYFLEYDWSPYACFKHTVEVEKGKYRISKFDKKVPLVFSIKAMNAEFSIKQ